MCKRGSVIKESSHTEGLAAFTNDASRIDHDISH